MVVGVDDSTKSDLQSIFLVLEARVSMRACSATYMSIETSPPIAACGGFQGVRQRGRLSTEMVWAECTYECYLSIISSLVFRVIKIRCTYFELW
jgi:hypothetical protein